MIKATLIHPQILAALGRAGHSSKVLITDGNYPHWTKKGPNAEVVFMNLAPGVISCTDALKALVTAVPIEAADLMDYARTGPYAVPEEPPIWSDFRQVLKDAGANFDLGKIERFKFYDAACTPDVCLIIATGEQRIFANLLLTIGVVKPKA
jgi:L-fucose mutarotase